MNQSNCHITVEPASPSMARSHAQPALPELEPAPAELEPALPPVLRAIVKAAVRAPSAGNCQPWRWTHQRCADGAVRWLSHERARSERSGIRAPPALGAAVESAVLAAMQAAAGASAGAQLHWLTDPGPMGEMAQLIGAADRIRMLDQQLHAAMMQELRWSAEQAGHSGDGVEVDLLEPSAADRAGLGLCRSWPAMQMLQRIGGGFALEKLAGKVVNQAPALGVLTMPADDFASALEAGRALQRAWLTATRAGLALYPMFSLPYFFALQQRAAAAGLLPSQLAEIASLQQRYRQLFGAAAPCLLMVLTLSHAAPARGRSLRRPLDAVLDSR